ncbi:MAG: FAD-binding protein, partial [Clostridia bacterium]
RYWLPTFGGKWSEKVFLTIGGLWPRSMDAASIGAQGSIGGNAGNMYIKPLQAFVTDAGNEVMVNTKATDMIVEDGRIIGVKAEDTTNGQRYDLYGKKGVILATGGFGANAEMVEQYSGSKVTRTTNHAGATGDGILLAQSVGAELVGMQYVQTFPLANPQTGALKIHYSGSVTIVKESALSVSRGGATKFAMAPWRRPMA